MTDIRWVGFIGIPPLPRQVVASFTAPDRTAAKATLARLVAAGGAPADTHLQSRVEFDEVERRRLERASRNERNRRLGFTRR